MYTFKQLKNRKAKRHPADNGEKSNPRESGGGKEGYLARQRFLALYGYRGFARRVDGGYPPINHFEITFAATVDRMPKR